MRKIIFTALIAAMACSCGPRDGYKITGNITGLDQTVYLISEYGEPLDSSAVKNGKFQFRGSTQEPGVYYLGTLDEPFTMIFLENGAIKVTGSMDSRINVRGTTANDRNDAFMAGRDLLVERFHAAADDKERRAIIEQDEGSAQMAVDSNLDNMFGLYMLTELEYSADANIILRKLSEFTPELQRTSLAAGIRERAEAKKRTDIGQPYIDIMLPDKDDRQITLSSLVGPGKYVLIDFWASWCGPCMEEIPYLVRTYGDYHRRGFEIYGVSLDRSPEDWQKTVSERKMDWTQVINTPTGTAVSDYSVFSIPSNFLIGPEGTIIAKNLRGEEVEKKIAEYLKR